MDIIDTLLILGVIFFVGVVIKNGIEFYTRINKMRKK